MALSKFGKAFAFRGYEYETCNSAAKRIRNDGEHVFGFPHILQLAEYKVNEFSASFSSYSAAGRRNVRKTVSWNSFDPVMHMHTIP